VRVFVTGGTGFVGAHVVPALQSRGHDVVCLVRDPAKAAAVFAPPGPTLVAGDLHDDDALARGLAGADAVVHLAGLTAARSRAELFAVNEDRTRALAHAATAIGKPLGRFVYVSSLAAAGPVGGGTMPTGSEVPRPVSDYGRSKLAGETPIRALAVPWTILRPPAVYGPRDREMLRLFAIARRGIAPTFGDGGQRLSLVYGPDLAAAIVGCVEREHASGVHYPAHRTTTTSRALVVAIAAALGVRTRTIAIPRAVVRPALWLSGTAARVAGRATLMSADKANELLADAWLCDPTAFERAVGWRAETDLDTGLRMTAAWYRRAGWL
jgi:nucleoside-diphosphate-sugar epimerase